MKLDSLDLALLFDFYGELLTEKQRSIFDQYYNQDYSLSEIAENEGISRQGVHDAITRAEQTLQNFEACTGCVARHRRTQLALHAIAEEAIKLENCTDAAAQKAASTIRAILDTIEE